MRFLKPKIETVAVLGCGPAGLFAAHAAASLGLRVLIFSNKVKSKMYGAQYLHAPIDGLSSKAPQRIMYTLDGTEEEYAEKVYGPNKPPFVSVAKLQKLHFGWDIREAYDAAWDKYQGMIQPYSNITAEDLLSGSLASLLYDRHLQVISTIPAKALCHAANHQFVTQPIWAIGDAPELGQRVEIDLDPFSVMCNGLDGPSWYRAANVFGHKTVEWPGKTKPPVNGVVRVEKIVRTDCDCFVPQIWRAGRMGTFTKGVLSHHAYTYTLEALEALA